MDFLIKSGFSLSKEEVRDADVSAISVEQAVSMAYRGGNQIQDTGFSLHDWALVVINDTEKVKWRGKFQEMKKAWLDNDKKAAKCCSFKAIKCRACY